MLPNPTEPLWVEGAGHNDCEARAGAFSDVTLFPPSNLPLSCLSPALNLPMPPSLSAAPQASPLYMRRLRLLLANVIEAHSVAAASAKPLGGATATSPPPPAPKLQREETRA